MEPGIFKATQDILLISNQANVLHLIMNDDCLYCLQIEEKRNACHKLVLGHAEGELCGLAVSPSDCNLFASCSHDNTLRLWNFKNLKVHIFVKKRKHVNPRQYEIHHRERHVIIINEYDIK